MRLCALATLQEGVLMNGEDKMKWLGGVLAGAAWFTLVMMDKASVDTFVQFLQYFLVGIAAHGATLATSPRTPAPPPPVPAAQGGYSGIGFLLFLVGFACVVFLLSGCA